MCPPALRVREVASIPAPVRQGKVGHQKCKYLDCSGRAARVLPADVKPDDAGVALSEIQVECTIPTASVMAEHNG